MNSSQIKTDSWAFLPQRIASLEATVQTLKKSIVFKDQKILALEEHLKIYSLLLALVIQKIEAIESRVGHIAHAPATPVPAVVSAASDRSSPDNISDVGVGSEFFATRPNTPNMP